MYSKAKYVVGVPRSGFFDGLCAVVFSEIMDHCAVSEVFVPGSIVSAGFCHAEADEVRVYGRSASLKLASRPEDAELVGRAIAHKTTII